MEGWMEGGTDEGREGGVAVMTPPSLEGLHE